MWNKSYNVEGRIVLSYWKEGQICLTAKQTAENYWSIIVYMPSQSMRFSSFTLFEEDIDVLKFKCLIKMKENGWKIESVIEKN